MIEDTEDGKTDGQESNTSTSSDGPAKDDSNNTSESSTSAPAPTSKAASDGAVGKTADELRADPSPAQQAAIDDPQAGAGETKVSGEPLSGVVATPTVISDPTGQVSNRVEGTIQREPTPEEMPSDAKIAPLAEQVNPNAAGQAVGAAPTPEEIAGVPQPEEGNKQPVSDGSDINQFLPPDSEQHEDAERATEDAARDADRGIAQSRT